MVRSGSIFRVLLTFLFAYLFFIGATFNGILNPQLKIFNLMLLVVILGGWLGIHYLRKWQWYALPLDKAFVLWGVAIAVSLIANLDAWRRITIGIWFVILYVLIWYLVQDAIANRAMKRDTLIDMMLMGSVVVVIFGYVQLSTLNFDLAQLELPRPGSTIGNPNSFGAFLVVIFPFSLSRTLLLKNRFAKVILGFYSLALLFLLFLTFSRGAWLGGFAGLVVITLLYLQNRNLLSFTRLVLWWRSLRRSTKFVLAISALISIIILLVAGALLFDSLDESGRDVDLRTRIYQFAVELFVERPLTGHGLFTFGQAYERLESMPPRQPHSHAHNLILNVGAEMGLLGLIAVIATVIIALRQMRDNWSGGNNADRPAMMGAIGSIFGFGIHHLFDTPAMMPVIALVGMLSLILATAPNQSERVKVIWRRTGQGFGLAILTIALLISGFWSAGGYQTYLDAIVLASEDNGRDYLGAARAMQSAINADPLLALYHAQQGFLYGMDANANSNPESVQSGIASYEQYLELEPQSAIGWANLAGLYWQSGEQELALSAMQDAVDLAPLSWQFRLNLGMYAEAIGNGDLARQTYGDAINATNYVLAFWQETPLRQDIWDNFEIIGINLVQLAIINGEPLSDDEVEPLWNQSGLANRESTEAYIYRLLLEIRADNPDNFERLLSRANTLVIDDEDRAWVHVGQAYIARYLGDNPTYELQLDHARDLLELSVLGDDYPTGVNIGHFQFLRFVIPRQFLPQVIYPTTNAFLLWIIER